MQVNLDLNQIKNIVGAECSFNGNFFIENITSIENAKERDLAVLVDRGSESVFDQLEIDKIKNSRAGIILASKQVCPNKNYIIVEDPLLAFNKIVDFIEGNGNRAGASKFDPTAVISPSAVLGERSSVGACSIISGNVKVGTKTVIKDQVFIGKNVEIGNNVKIYPGAKILDNCKIGDNSIIHSGAVIGSDGYGYSVTKFGLRKIPQIGIVEIGKNVEIGANCSVDRASFEKTIIGDGAKIDNQVHIAHNVIIGPQTAILAHTGIAGGVEIGAACQIGGQVAIKDHVKIGNGVKIVSKSGVMKDVPDGQVIAGIPAIPFSKWKRLMVILPTLPDLVKRFSLSRKKKGFWSKFFG